MYIGYTEEQEALRKELRAYYEKLLTPELREVLAREHGVGETTRQVVRQMGADGWLGIGWPTEWGGQGRSEIEQFIFFDESMRSGAPVPMLTINTVGPTLMRNGSDELKRFFLPKILAGEIHFCIGYSEPQAGTDLAALTTRAVRDGDEYVVNGQKLWTSLASDADYCWLAVRTDPDAKKHKGISIILVPTDAPGFSCTPTYTLGRERTNSTYYENVRVPVSNRVGPENAGWGLITSQLNHERITLATPGFAESMLDEVWAWAAKTAAPGGGKMLEQQWVQIHLARVYAKLRALQVLNWRSAWSLTEGIPNMSEASALKVMGTEFFVEAYDLLLEIVSAAGIVVEGEPGALFGGLLENAYRGATTLTFGGGVNEVQRDIIAMAGMGLPHYKSSS